MAVSKQTSYYNKGRRKPCGLELPFYDGLMGTLVLPESERAVIDDPGNGGKAAFFLSLGYGPEDSAALREALLNVAALGVVVRQIDSAYGQKFVVDGWLQPNGSGSPMPVRSIWMVAFAGDAPRFVTAYPSQRVNH